MLSERGGKGPAAGLLEYGFNGVVAPPLRRDHFHGNLAQQAPVSANAASSMPGRVPSHARRVRIFLKEKGQAIFTTRVDLCGRVSISERFLGH